MSTKRLPSAFAFRLVLALLSGTFFHVQATAAQAEAWVAVGGKSAGKTVIHILEARSARLKLSIRSLGSAFKRGVTVAVGDVNGDGTPDVMAAPAKGGRPLVRVFDGATGAPMAGAVGRFPAFPSSYRGGLNLASGDVNGDGAADIIAGAGAGDPPRVRVFSGKDGSLLADFLAFEPGFRGGVRVASGDFRRRLKADIVAAPGIGGPPRIKVFSADDQSELANYLAFSRGFRGGVYVSTGDMNHDGTVDLVLGAGKGGRGRVKVHSGLTQTPLLDFKPTEAGTHDIHGITAADADGDGFDDLLLSRQTGVASRIEARAGRDGQLLAWPDSPDALPGTIYSLSGSMEHGRGTNFSLSAPVTNEIDPVERLARYIPADAEHTDGQYVAVRSEDIAAGKHVYVITHGWAPGYRDWVDAYLPGHVLKWWETAGFGGSYPAPSPDPGPASIWMFTEISQAGIPIAPAGGLAAQIVRADPDAVVLAYSWLDDSATTSTLSNSIPEQAYLSEALTNVNGARLASALNTVLGREYAGQIHLLGHSHGSKVATLAAVGLKQQGGPAVQQLTVFDSPESEVPDEGSATNYLWHFFPQLDISKIPGNGTFIDNYFSAFGIAYQPMQIDGSSPLGDLIDAQLYAYPYSELDLGDWHAYPPAWYAQANSQACSGSSNGGLAWSPLIGGDPSALPPAWEQSWSRFDYSAANQACLEQPFFTLTPSVTFDPLVINDADSPDKPAVSTIQLGLGTGQDAQFDGTYSKNSNWSGISFDYTFSGSGQGILKIQINDYLAYYVDSQYLQPGVTQHAALNIGWPSSSQAISVILLAPDGTASNAQVSLGNFRQFDVSNL